MFNLCDIAPRVPGSTVPGDEDFQPPEGPEQQPGALQPPAEGASGGTGKAAEGGGGGPGGHAGSEGAPPPPPPPPPGEPAAAAEGDQGGEAPVMAGQQQQSPSHASGGQPQQQQSAADAERERESEARFKARQRARMHDLGMILDVVLATTSDRVKREFVICGMLTQLQQTLGRIPFTQEYSVVLVKVCGARGVLNM